MFRHGRWVLVAVLVAACSGPKSSASAPASPFPSGSPFGGASGSAVGAPGGQGLAIGTPVLLGQQTGVQAALADSDSGPIVSVSSAQVTALGPASLAAGTSAGSSCPASQIGVVGTLAVKWLGASRSILYLAGGASAAGPVGIGFTPDCARMTVLAPATATSWTTSDAPSPFAGGMRFFGMQPGDPQTVAAWSPATGQLAMKGGFLSWSSDGGHTWQSQTSPAIPAGWDPSGAFWELAPGRLVSSRGPGFSFTGPSVPVGLTWDPSAGQIPSVMATGVFRERVLLGLRDAALQSVATDGSGTAHLAIAAWRISAGSRFLAVEGNDLGSGAPTLAVSSNGVHFVTAILPAEFASAGTGSVQLLALDDRVLLTDSPQTADPADQVIHVWSVPVAGAPEPPPMPTPVATPAIPSAPPAEATSIWTPVTLPTAPSKDAFGGPHGGISALPGGGFIDFVSATPTRTLVFTSSDGSHWTQTGEVTGEDAAGISGPVATNGHVYVALGAEGGGTYYGMQQNGAAWVSRDLRSWTKAPHQAAFGGTGFRSIAGATGGFVATGYSEGEGGSPAWFSADGLHWTEISNLRPSANDTVEATGVVHSGRGFVMVGRLDNGAAAWTSPDGQHWTMHAPLPGGADVVLNGLVDTGHGYLSLGWGGSQVEVTAGVFLSPVAPWVSTDGTTWKAGASSPALFGAEGTSLVAAPGGFVATGSVGLAVGLWTSRDGLDWVPVAGVQLADAEESRVVSDGRHVLLVATGQNGMRAFVSAGIGQT
jgi:hypothetical protein